MGVCMRNEGTAMLRLQTTAVTNVLEGPPTHLLLRALSMAATACSNCFAMDWDCSRVHT